VKYAFQLGATYGSAKNQTDSMVTIVLITEKSV
jgi:hypothetical protein